MKRRSWIRIVLVTAVGLSPFVFPQSAAASLTYPARNAAFPECASETDEFCVEKLSYVPDGGTSVDVASPATLSRDQPTKPYIDARFYTAAYNGPSTPADARGLLPNLYLMIKNRSGFTTTTNIATGLAAGTYSFRLRTGDFDPTFVVIQGEWVDHKVERGADGYFTLDVTARTAPFVTMETASIANCITLKWKTGCEADNGYGQWLGSALVMLQNPASREISRGSAISTSAPYVVANAPVANGPETKQTLSVAGPHFAPDGLLTSGTVEDSRYLYPAYYRKLIPYTAIVRSLKLIGVDTTEDGIKAFLAKRSLFRGTIQNSEGVAVPQRLTVTAKDAGVLIDFNLASFSAPNPTLYMSSPLREFASSSSGAAISPLRTAKKGQKVSRTALLGPSLETRIVSTVSKSKKVCTISGSSVRMLKSGKCILSVAIAPTTSATATPEKVSVTITVS